MRISVQRTVIALAAGTLLLGSVGGWAQGTPEKTVAAPGKPSVETAAEAFKNIQVLKDVPSDQLVPAMQFIAASLGVECDYCHVQRAFDKDDKKPKQTARAMMRMMLAIDRENFDGRREVTCYSCHRGATRPVSIPVIADVEPSHSPEAASEEREEAAAAVPVLPDAGALLDRYLAAVGGAAALEKISSRVVEGTMTAFGGREFPVEVIAKAPDKRMSIMHTPRGDSITAFDGRSGWLSTREGAREMSPSEAGAARLDADFYFPSHLRQLFSAFKVGPTTSIDGHDAALVVASNPGEPPVELYFDTQSGLLVRLVRYTETPLGRNPTQVDYGDYRAVDGVKVPFRWTLARPGGRFTIAATSVKQNVPVDDARFAMPRPEPAGSKPPAR